jgi:hypothetical protein
MSRDPENRNDGNAAEATQELPEKDRQVQAEKPIEELAPLFDDSEAENFRTQWMNIQSKFVEDPRASVQDADQLVADVLKSMAASFHERRTSLEKQWNDGNKDISTEDLRLMIKRYRSFFDRLLSLKP